MSLKRAAFPAARADWPVAAKIQPEPRHRSDGFAAAAADAISRANWPAALAAAAALPDSAIRRTIAEPTITPSATESRFATCSGPLIPNPTASGNRD